MGGAKESAKTAAATRATVQQFFLGLVRVGLLSPDDLRAWRQIYPPATDHDDAQSLAHRLVSEQRITTFQASALYQDRYAELLVGPYGIVERLRSAPAGAVYRAVHRQQGNVVELTVIVPSEVTAAAETQFTREAQSCASLHHIHLPEVVDWGADQGRFYLAAEAVEGNDLRWLVKHKGPISIVGSVTTIAQAARALAAAATKQITHGYLTPASIVVGAARQAKVLDLGLLLFAGRDMAGAEVAADDPSEESGLEARGLDYLSPERIVDPTVCDTRADVYSLGCILHRLLTGKRPFSGDSPAAKLQAHREQPIPRLRDRRREIPLEVEQVFQRMLAKRPEDRYQSMSELADALEQTMLSTADALPPGLPPPSAVAPASHETPPPAVPADLQPVATPFPEPTYAASPQFTQPLSSPYGGYVADPNLIAPANLEFQPLWSNPQAAPSPSYTDPWNAPQPQSLPQSSAASASVYERSERRGRTAWGKGLAFIVMWTLGGVIGLAAGYAALLEMHGQKTDYLGLWPYWVKYRQPPDRPDDEPAAQPIKKTVIVRKRSATGETTESITTTIEPPPEKAKP